MQTLARWVSTPESRSARAAVECVREGVCSGTPRREVNPLFLHGPTGTGKSSLTGALIADVARSCPDSILASMRVDEFTALAAVVTGGQAAEDLAAVRDSDLFILEDLQHLAPRWSETLVQLFDDRLARQRAMIFTASVGPRHLEALPLRLASRLASGLVVGLEPLATASRLALLQDRVERRQLDVGQEVLAWLAKHLPGSGRAVEGAVTKLEGLTRLLDRLPILADVQLHFQEECPIGAPTVEKIVERVSGYFQVEAGQLQSRHRQRHALVPRQVGMYLARQLTPLSLEQIGAYFGGRDHSTVLHACRKIEQALANDPNLSGAVRQLHADLT